MSLLTALRRPRQDTPPPALEPQIEKTDPNVVMRFRTLGGAVVTVTRRTRGYRSECQGCGWTRSRDVGTDPERYARDDANSHAGGCRSMPKPGESQR